MCVEIMMDKIFSSDKEILQAKECARKNSLGIIISLKEECILIESYKGVCFCTPKDGFREALENFVEEVLGKNYYFLYEIEPQYIYIVEEKKYVYDLMEEGLNFEELAEEMRWNLKGN